MSASASLSRLGGAMVMCVALACGGSSTAPEVTPPVDATPPVVPAADSAITITPGTTIGRAAYPAGNTPQGGRGGSISGVDCINSNGAYHIHSHLTLFVKGEQIAIAAGIGVVPPVLENGYATFNPSSCFYWLHTHDATGVIHVNPAVLKDMTLGMMFDVWGYPLSRTEVAGNIGAVIVYVDGIRYEGDPRDIVFVDNKEISLQVGVPLVKPPLYRIPANP